MNKRIYLCLAHMSGKEQMYIKEAFDTELGRASRSEREWIREGSGGIHG